ncbi:Rec102p LALA0_S02e05226g [Lachancea lanzarotensis]|uniref:LALA0S02e05226g1_1 n=1 Tax=Lachancea lanzarotensis TaxID=1245769 RepID=A0A0C7N3A4_9SACH|nr:uncharacterized protein LALA0_S02e05226g [Lachancea lanzarotensis]CEP61032.1 LALA0S02e05226g1_1 [Lachancea lanzarotensis]
MYISFEPVFLANDQRNVYSEWQSSVSIESNDSKNAINEHSIVLPPRQKHLQIKIVLFSNEEMVLKGVTQTLANAFTQCLQFWRDLNYRVTVDIASDNCVLLTLECQIFSVMKTKNLLEQPLSVLKHMDLQLATISAVTVNATLSSSLTPLEIDGVAVVKHCNFFLVSLLISQLEFHFPLVFSRVCRLRFLQQEASLGPVSYALTSSASLVPKLVKIISDDKTATTCYRIIEISSDRRKLKRMLKFKNGTSPIQILKHSCICTSDHANC